MELASKNLYEAFKTEILKELGPLDPNWFEVLTAQVSAKDGNGSDQEDLCANQEGYFKAPLDRTATESQLFSTPKVFRHSRVVSPETEGEQSFTADQEKGKLPWTPTQSPCWMSKQGAPVDKHGGIQPQIQNAFDPVHTPRKSTGSYAQQISESLGAQVDSDISWTSSFNTPPPPLPSTLILSKTDASPCPDSLTTEKDIVFVRKLFPSLSNGSKVGATQPKDEHSAYRGTVSPEAHKSLQTPSNQSEDGWQQKLPDAIEDGEIRTTVASVLKGAENVLSIFFANSSSTLRKVKPDRIKRRQIIQTNERCLGSPAISATNASPSTKAKATDQEPGRCPPSTPEKTAVSQWSPLKSSETPPYIVDNILTKQVKNCDSAFNNLIRPRVIITDSGFIRKKRKFRYTVGKPQSQEKEAPSQKIDSSQQLSHSGQDVTQLLKVSEEKHCFSIRKTMSEKLEEHPTGEVLPASVQAKVQDLDMSQLCRDFAQDFSQMPESGKLSKSLEDAQKFFSPSVCLSAMKQAKQKAGQVNLHHDYEGVRSRRPVSATNPNYSITEGTAGDSGFQSAIADIALTTSSSFVLPCSDNTGQGQQCTGFKVDNYQTTPSTTNGNEKAHLDAGAETKLPCGQEIQILPIQSTSTKLASSDNRMCIQQNGQIHSSLPEKTAVTSTSVQSEIERTFSNQQTPGDHSTKCNTITSNGSVKHATPYSYQLPPRSGSQGEASCQLTASQKADVTELCTLLEEADSQFEFTQHKHVKQQVVVASPQKADRDIDPDFLTGIDFDDSFSSDAEKHMAEKTSISNDKRTTNNTIETTDISFSSAVIKENPYAGGAVSSTEHTFEGSRCLVPAEHKRQHRAESSETSKMEDKNPLTLGVAFKTAGGNVLRISETCLNKARALFADFEGNPTDQKQPDNQNHDPEVKPEQKQALDPDADNKTLQYTLRNDTNNGEKIQGCTNVNESTKSFKNSRMDVTRCQGDFHMASGKGIFVSGKNMQQAEAFFKDCDGISVEHKRSIQAVAECVDHKKKLSKPNVNGLAKFKNVNAGLITYHPTESHPEDVEMNSVDSKASLAVNNAGAHCGNPFSTSKPFSSPLGTTSKSIDSSAINELSSADGFCTASGKKVSVSAGAMKRAECLFNEIQTPEDSNKQQNLQGDALGAGQQLHMQKQVLPPVNVGFQTASGKGVLISSAALKKAKSLLSECEETEDKICVKPPHIKIPIVGQPLGNGGFQTASGKGVAISSEALKKAKSLLSECGEMEDKISVTLPGSGPPHRSDGFVAASGKPVDLSAEALQKAKAVFSDIDFSVEMPHDSHTRKGGQTQNVNERHCGFTTAGGARVHVSEKKLLKAKHLLKESDDSTREMQELEAFFKDCDMEVNSGMEVKPVSRRISNKKHLSKVKLDEKVADNLSTEHKNGITEDTNKLVKQKEDSVPSQNSGFQTASGKGVTVSSAALKKAQILLNECEEAKDKTSVKPSYFKSPAPGPSPRNSRFQTASGGGVSVSSEALKKAKTLLSECEEATSNIPPLGPPPQKGGFQTASGKGVVISPEALKKAKSLLSDCQETEDKICVKPPHIKITAPGPPPYNGGFQTASGKGVAISPEALKKAKSLLSECDDMKDKISVTLPGSGPPPRNGGFRAASGKPVDLSAEALQKAKALFSDVVSIEMPGVSHPGRSGKIHCGFTTAGGAKVHVSEKSLMKAKHLLKESDDSVPTKETQEIEAFLTDCDMDDGLLRNPTSIGPANRSSSKKKCMSDQRGTVHIHDELGDKCSEKRKGTFPPQNSGFQTASGRGVTVSSAALKKAKFLLSECEDMVDKGCVKSSHFKSPAPDPPPRNAGFQTASGKGVSISSEALKKAKTLLSDCEGGELSLTLPNSKITAPGPPPRNGWKGLTISSEAVKKAKFLLTECDDVRDKVCDTLSDSGPPPRMGGFRAASGKPLELSSDALQKANVLFSDISLSADIPADTGTERRANPHEHTEKVHSSFTPAGGGKVHVSDKRLNSDSENVHGSNELDQLKVNDVKRTTANDKDIPANGGTCLQEPVLVNNPVESGSIRDEAAEQIFPSGASSLHDSCGHEGNQTGSNTEPESMRRDESSVLHFHSLNLTGCTETQQRFLAQEALDCTKALLEDEAGQSLSMTLESMPLQKNSKFTNNPLEEGKGRGKRSVEDADTNGQPPLKRRLLDRFNRAVDGSRGSTLQPMKSCPNGVMKDRGVFMYSAALHPNTTKPHRDGNTFVETRLQKTTLRQCSNPGDNGPAHSRMPAFVHPFIKNTKAEKSTVLENNIRTPSVFVPPFKKQRTTVQESSSKPQEEENKHYHRSVTPPNSNTYVPPTKKIQGADVTLADTASDNTVNTESLPAGHVSFSSSAEVSHVEDTFSTSQDIYLENTELARDMQDMRIRKKKRQTIRPQPGSLFLTKTSGLARILLKIAVNGKPPARYTQKQLYEYGVHKHVSQITSETAESFHFSLQQFIKRETFADGGGIQLADGGWLIPKNNGTAGKEEFYRALCDTPGVDPKLISEAWVYNHYRWIVWKQASIEKSFPETMGSLCLTPEQVLRQLKYRYDVEVDHSRRPALRKIMEKDDTAAKTLVLCVCGVVFEGHFPNRQSVTKTPQAADAKVESPCAVVWLTDGWYAIKAQLDEPLTAMLHKGRLAVGGKLIIHGAQLVGSQDACSPLEAPESLMLKICANSSRPARWDAKLGFHRDPRPFLLPVSSLFSNGGPVGCVDVVVLRSYPIQWMERKPDGGVVFRSVRAEEKEARRYNNHKQKAMETLFAKIQAEFEKEKGNVKSQKRRRTMSHQDISSLQDGEELYEAVGDDLAYIETYLSEQQLETLHAYRRFLMEKKQAELQDRYRRAVEAEDNDMSCPKRDVTPVWRLCVSDCVNQHCSVYQLNFWRPSSDLQSLLKEGCRYKVYNLTTSDGKKRSSTETVQLTGTKKTQFQELQASKEWLAARFQPRVSTNFKNLQNPEFQPLCGEVDLSGYVVSLIDGQDSSPAFYLVDGELNFVKVRCFSSLSQSGLEDVVKPRVLLALSNLQLRGQSMFPTPVLYAGDLTVFSTNPKEIHLQESLSQLKNLIQRHHNFFSTAEEKLSHLVKSDHPSSVSSPALQPQTTVSTTTEQRATSQKPVGNLGFSTPVSKNPPATSSSTEKDPRSLKRRKALAYLSRIPSPPPLSCLGSVTSPSVKKTFNPPRKSGTPSTLKTVCTPAPKPSHSLGEDEWVNDEELAMIDTQALLGGDSLSIKD
ncbi:breast cancer type 2 susceptibility protein [Parambassis ranga]|uniref:Breast cancer type 2 susceptibility protein n=1 Tax=Parambassis ranga TaxID=210632 RepID=A0A6P7JJZ1_9TELE|nr:breast cancer type 2 susceptibility protein [Parambassis ranga]